MGSFYNSSHMAHLAPWPGMPPALGARRTNCRTAEKWQGALQMLSSDLQLGCWKTHISYHSELRSASLTSRPSALRSLQVCEGLRGTLPNILEIPALLWEGPQHSGKLHLQEPLIYKEGSRSESFFTLYQGPKPHGAIVPVCVPLPRCCCADPLALEVMRINLLLGS